MSVCKFKTQEGFTCKVLAELLQFNFKECCFVCKPTGIYVSCMDTKVKNGTKYINVRLFNDKFKIYKLNSGEDFHLGLNLNYFFKVLKSIKRKDSITLTVEEKDPNKLLITIDPPGDSNSIVKDISIIKISPTEDYEYPDESYGSPIVASCKEFQKLKTLNKMSKYITVTQEDSQIFFYSDKEGVYSTKISFGEKSDKTDDDMEIFEQQFETEDIIQLIKVAGLSQSVQIYFVQGLPLKIKLNVGTLGDLTIYIKSKEMVDEEKGNDNS